MSVEYFVTLQSVTESVIIMLTGPLLLIVEYAKNGNLRDFLETCRDGINGYGRYVSPDDPAWFTKTPGGQVISRKNLISFAFQVSRGMEFLSSKKVKCLIFLFDHHKTRTFGSEKNIYGKHITSFHLLLPN